LKGVAIYGATGAALAITPGIAWNFECADGCDARRASGYRRRGIP